MGVFGVLDQKQVAVLPKLKMNQIAILIVIATNHAEHIVHDLPAVAKLSEHICPDYWRSRGKTPGIHLKGILSNQNAALLICAAAQFSYSDLSLSCQLGDISVNSEYDEQGRRVEDLGVYEMIWDCRFCGSSALPARSARFCPHCGAAQEPAARRFPSDEEFRCRVPQNFWEQAAVESRWNVSVNALTGQPDCSTLERAS
jgi:hypothetical protein